MAQSYVGEFCAVAAALCWAFALIFFKLSGDRIAPIPLSLFKNVVAIILLAATLLVTSDSVDTLWQFEGDDVAILLLSGALGIALADTIFFYALRLIGVGIISIVDCLYSPLIILFSYLILWERLTPKDYAGMAMILAAVFLSSRHAPPVGRTRFQVTLGVLLAGVSMALMAFGIVIAKPVLEVSGFPLIWATTLRMVAGTVLLALMTAASPQRKEYWAVFRPSPDWKYSIPASVLGSYLAMIFWVAGFKYTKAYIAGILNQTSTIFAIILATLLLKEPFTRRKLIAVILATGGVVLVTL